MFRDKKKTGSSLKSAAEPMDNNASQGRTSTSSEANKHFWRRRKFWLVLAGAIILLIGLANLLSYFGNHQRYPIKIGEQTITKQAVNDYKKEIEAYLKRNPAVSFGGDSTKIAIDDLVLNAALKTEAKQRGVSFTNSEMEQFNKQRFTTDKELKKYEDYLSDKTITNLLVIRNENEFYKEKLDSVLIAKEDLLTVEIPYDTAFHHTKTEAEQRQLHEEAINKLNTEFMPLIEQGASVKDIAAKTDIFYNTSEPTKPKVPKKALFDKQIFTYSKLVAGYPGPPGNLPTTFNDIENTDEVLGFHMADLRDTDDMVATLKNVGDHTPVFASKAGSHMIIRLEAKQDGPYTSYAQMLDTYREKYAVSRFQKAYRPINNWLKKWLDFLKKFGNSILPIAYAEPPPTVKGNTENPGSCPSSHNVHFTFTARDYYTWAEVPGGARVRKTRTSGCGYIGTFDRWTSTWFPENCMQGAPTWSIVEIKAGYTFHHWDDPNGVWHAGLNGSGGVSFNIWLIPPTPPPTVDLKVNNSNTPSPINVGNGITVSWIAYNSTSCTASGDWSGPKTASPSTTRTEDNTSDSNTAGTKTYTIVCSGPGGPPASDSVPITVNSPDVCPNLPGAQTSVPDGYAINSSGDCVELNYPYLRVYGGDVLAGSGFGDACIIPASSQIIGYNNGGGVGAGTQFGAQAFNTIDKFASAVGRSSNPQPDKGLTFANTGSGFGGNFEKGICAKNYYEDVTSGTSDPGSSIGAKSLRSKATDAVTDRLIYKHDGDVTITGNITFNGSSGANKWSSLNQIPSFYLIVRGNIKIDKGVSQLDGVYIAQPNTTSPSTTGRIYTCTNGSSTYTATNTTIYSNCSNSKLTINGAFVAQQVKFLRTKGNLKNSTNGENSSSADQAETFVYSPEMWLINPGLTPLNLNPYDSITSLPPVL